MTQRCEPRSPAAGCSMSAAQGVERSDAAAEPGAAAWCERCAGSGSLVLRIRKAYPTAFPCPHCDVDGQEGARPQPVRSGSTQGITSARHFARVVSESQAAGRLLLVFLRTLRDPGSRQCDHVVEAMTAAYPSLVVAKVFLTPAASNLTAVTQAFGGVTELPRLFLVFNASLVKTDLLDYTACLSVPGGRSLLHARLVEASGVFGAPLHDAAMSEAPPALKRCPKSHPLVRMASSPPTHYAGTVVCNIDRAWVDLPVYHCPACGDYDECPVHLSTAQEQAAYTASCERQQPLRAAVVFAAPGSSALPAVPAEPVSESSSERSVHVKASDLKCVVCTFPYDNDEREPRVLTCGHTLCADCVRILAREQPQQSHLLCPLDRVVVMHDQVAVNWALKQLITSASSPEH